MSIVSEFREFIARGNVIDLAVGVIIGAAFNNIVKSLVDQVLMPTIGYLAGGVDFSRYQWVLREEDPATPAVELVSIQYGAFLNTVIQFLIVAWAVFMLVKLINFIRREQDKQAEAEAQAGLTHTDALLTEIRDLLKAQQEGRPV
ncbi:MAG: large-conductance mechanosensitive channel protein MscL [Phenylobacterium sp.]|jgi:large conductance mechanosensitive channel|uniref:large-conductance mechanosensitive channel protein MscL n=1 Tax=Phenylobacterium sp. TaxID=1871053 RepID=UPI002A36B088|nr:large-conductance mechanosensitive channel protein MscL [Phenylobacterium sp.]MDX9996530.1 large-conductance mechanosensitive channel protein MscL [Phenylobacterium sp.]